MTGYIGAIEKQTRENTYFRQVLFTAQHAQLVALVNLFLARKKLLGMTAA